MLLSRLFGGRPVRSTRRSRAGRKSVVESLEGRQLLSVGHPFGSQIVIAPDVQKVHDAVADVAGGNGQVIDVVATDVQSVPGLRPMDFCKTDKGKLEQ